MLLYTKIQLKPEHFSALDINNKFALQKLHQLKVQDVWPLQKKLFLLITST